MLQVGCLGVDCLDDDYVVVELFEFGVVNCFDQGQILFGSGVGCEFFGFIQNVYERCFWGGYVFMLFVFVCLVMYNQDVLVIGGKLEKMGFFVVGFLVSVGCWWF